MIEKIIEILEHYGHEAQKLKAVEELTELSEKIIKEVNKGTDTGIGDEIADVFIMLTQLELIYDIDPFETRERIEYKLDRQIERIRNGKEERN